MSTNLTIANQNIPAHLAGRVGQLSTLMQTALASMQGDSVPRLKLEQGRWRIREGGEEVFLDTLHADVIVVGVVPGVTKTFYAAAYVPGQEPKSPDCSSILGDKPDAGSTAPQCASCAACPQNVWGSKITPQGTEVKACSDAIRIAVVSADDPSGVVYQCQVPAASMKNFKGYVRQLGARGLSLDMVVTRMTGGVANYPLYEFNAVGFADAQQYAAVSEVTNSTSVQEVLGLFGRQTITALPAPAAQPAPAPQAVQPAPAPAPVAEPTVPKRGFRKNAAAPAPAPAPQAAPAPAPAPQPAAQVASASMSELEAQIAALSAV